MPAGGLIAGGAMIGAGTAGNIIASGKQSDATQKIAQEQLRTAQANRAVALQFAAPTAMELANMNQQIQTAGVALQRQQKIFDSIDPAIMEASKQSLELIQGKNANTIAPILAQRDVQRTKLMQQLQTQLGPGGQSSSAGQQALQNFDLQTNTLQTQLQQQAIGTLGNFMTQGAQTAQTGLQSGNQAQALFGQIGSQAGSIQARQASASIGTNLTGYAGANYTGQYANASNFGSISSGIGSGGFKLLGAGLAPSKGTTETSTGTPAQSSTGSGWNLGNDYNFND